MVIGVSKNDKEQPGNPLPRPFLGQFVSKNAKNRLFCVKISILAPVQPRNFKFHMNHSYDISKTWYEYQVDWIILTREIGTGVSRNAENRGFLNTKKSSSPIWSAGDTGWMNEIDFIICSSLLAFQNELPYSHSPKTRFTMIFYVRQKWVSRKWGEKTEIHINWPIQLILVSNEGYWCMEHHSYVRWRFTRVSMPITRDFGHFWPFGHENPNLVKNGHRAFNNGSNERYWIVEYVSELKNATKRVSQDDFGPFWPSGRENPNLVKKWSQNFQWWLKWKVLNCRISFQAQKCDKTCFSGWFWPFLAFWPRKSQLG